MTSCETSFVVKSGNERQATVGICDYYDRKPLMTLGSSQSASKRTYAKRQPSQEIRLFLAGGAESFVLQHAVALIAFSARGLCPLVAT